MSQKKFCITFAGAVGSSKTPIAHYLSCSFGLPILSNDVIRTEVKEEFLSSDEYERRRDERAQKLIQSGVSFIYDASVDRRWAPLKEHLEKAGYRWFLVSIDLSEEFLKKIYKEKKYNDVTQEWLEKLLHEHEKFLEEYEKDVAVHISEEMFPARLELSREAFIAWFQK